MKLIPYLKCIATLSAGAALTSCVAAAVVTGVTAGAAGSSITEDSRSFHTMQDDHDAGSFAQTWIDRDETLDNHSHITVQVYNHVALIVGQADTDALKDRAYTIVSRTPSIKQIYNEVTVGPSISASARMKDSWITTKVKTALINEAELKSNHVHVVTEDKTVYLMGVMTPHQAALAVEAARSVSGVNKVTRVFEMQK
jgi:osmotically-inducible protein OsmY